LQPDVKFDITLPPEFIFRADDGDRLYVGSQAVRRISPPGQFGYPVTVHTVVRVLDVGKVVPDEHELALKVQVESALAQPIIVGARLVLGQDVPFGLQQKVMSRTPT